LNVYTVKVVKLYDTNPLFKSHEPFLCICFELTMISMISTSCSSVRRSLIRTSLDHDRSLLCLCRGRDLDNRHCLFRNCLPRKLPLGNYYLGSVGRHRCCCDDTAAEGEEGVAADVLDPKALLSRLVACLQGTSSAEGSRSSGEVEVEVEAATVLRSLSEGEGEEEGTRLAEEGSVDDDLERGDVPDEEGMTGAPMVAAAAAVDDDPNPAFDRIL
jgi:hypothetical protein